MMVTPPGRIRRGGGSPWRKSFPEINNRRETLSNGRPRRSASQQSSLAALARPSASEPGLSAKPCDKKEPDSGLSAKPCDEKPDSGLSAKPCDEKEPGASGLSAKPCDEKESDSGTASVGFSSADSRDAKRRRLSLKTNPFSQGVVKEEPNKEGPVLDENMVHNVKGEPVLDTDVVVHVKEEPALDTDVVLLVDEKPGLKERKKTGEAARSLKQAKASENDKEVRPRLSAMGCLGRSFSVRFGVPIGRMSFCLPSQSSEPRTQSETVASHGGM